MREVAYFLERLDSAECREANGKTILENSLITVSTESGDGRHSDVKRELSGVFHAITGANGRFKTGHVMDIGAEGLDVTDRKDILIADDPAAFAAAVLEVMREPELRESLSRGGQELVSAKYSAAAMGRAMNELMDRVVKGRAGGPAALP